MPNGAGMRVSLQVDEESAGRIALAAARNQVRIVQVAGAAG
jgi:hypothetical protein